MSALLVNACKETIAKVTDLATEIASVSTYSILIGGAYGALVVACIAAEKPLLKKLKKHWFKKSVKATYTLVDHDKITESGKNVYIPLLNLNTKKVEYFDLSKISYAVAVLVLQAAMMGEKKVTKINNCFYLDGILAEQNTFSHLAKKKIKEATIIFPRSFTHDKWEPSKTNVLKRLFHILRCEAAYEKTEYEIKTIAEARSIKLNIFYLT